MHLTPNIDFYALVCAFIENNKIKKKIINLTQSILTLVVVDEVHMVNKEGKIKRTEKLVSCLLTSYKQLRNMSKLGENHSVAHMTCFCH